MPEPALDLQPRHLEMVRKILQERIPGKTVWAFGSRAKGTAKPYSDLDLTVITDEPLDLNVLGALKEDFSESDLPFRVDVVDWATTKPIFRAIIERDKRVVQSG